MATKKRSKSKSETYAQYRKRILRVQKQIRSMSNPRKIKGKSTTLKNMASVTVTKLPNGVVKITGRKMAKNPAYSGSMYTYTPSGEKIPANRKEVQALKKRWLAQQMRAVRSGKAQARRKRK
jgi:hypothetical protein